MRSKGSSGVPLVVTSCDPDYLAALDVVIAGGFSLSPINLF
jgi:hypothetical protein